MNLVGSHTAAFLLHKLETKRWTVTVSSLERKGPPHYDVVESSQILYFYIHVHVRETTAKIGLQATTNNTYVGVIFSVSEQDRSIQSEQQDARFQQFSEI